MARVTRNWKECRFALGTSAYESYTIDGVSNKTAAIQAAPYQVGSTYKEDGSLTCQTQPEVQEVNPGSCYRVGITFGPGGSYTAPDPDPLKRPMRWHLETMITQEIVDRDVFLNPLVNTAQDPFPDVQVEREDLVAVGRRYEPSFSVSNWLKYRGAIASDSLTLPKIGTLAPGEPCLIAYSAVDDWDKNTKYVQVEYRLLLRPGNPVTVAGKKLADGHMRKFLDRGTRGFFSKSGVIKKADFYNEDPTPKAVGDPVRLDGTGRPKESRYKVGSGLETAVASNIKFADNILDKTNKDAVYIRYCMRPIVAFAPLKLDQ